MLDVKYIREHPDEVARAFETRGGAESVQQLLRLDADRRRRVTAVEALKAERNKVTAEIAQAKRRGESPTEEMARMRKLGDEIKEMDAAISGVEGGMNALLLRLPTLPPPSVPVGRAEDNQEVRRWGAPRQFPFDPKPHWEVGERLGILDFERAAKLAKARFAVLWGAGARLERALAQFMLDLHTREHGYREVWVPHLVNAETMQGTGQLPKFEAQLFRTLEAEGGAGGQDGGGMLRQHQPNKWELVKVTPPATSYDELEAMVGNAEEVLKRLEVPHRGGLLAPGGTGGGA